MTRFRLSLELLRPVRGRLLAALALTVVYTVFSLTPPLALRYLIDKVISPHAWGLFPLAITFVIGLPLWNAALAAVNRVVIAAIGQRLVADLRTTLYRHVLSLSMRFHGKTGAGPVMNHLMSDVGIVQSLLTGETLGIVSSIAALVFSVGMAFAFSWRLAVALVITVSLYAANYYKFALRIRRANLEWRELMDQVTGQLQERIAGVRLVKIYGRERDETNAFLASTGRALQIGMRSQMLSISLSATARLIGGIGSSLIWCAAAASVLSGDMTYGSMLALDSYVWQAITPAINLTMVANTIAVSMVSLRRILDIMSQQPDVREKPEATDLPDEVRGELALQDVTFAYEQDTPLFQGLSLHIPAGKMTALVGHTGCGKTTVTSLLTRLWDVQGGRVAVDGRDVRDVALRSLRRHIGVVPQEPVIFEGTVFDNIAYAHPEATMEQAEEAARAAQIHDHIVALPEGYQTWLGKEGAKLSVGQKQRIAIARAILRKPAILILDEATSSLDSESEAALQKAMRLVLHERTSVVVAHRLSTIVEADRIVVMDHGAVKEIGTHEQLMGIEDGLYRRLYDELKGKQGQEVMA